MQAIWKLPSTGHHKMSYKMASKSIKRFGTCFTYNNNNNYNNLYGAVTRPYRYKGALQAIAQATAPVTGKQELNRRVILQVTSGTTAYRCEGLIILFCIVSIHIYSASHSVSLSEALPSTEMTLCRSLYAEALQATLSEGSYVRDG